MSSVCCPVEPSCSKWWPEGLGLLQLNNITRLYVGASPVSATARIPENLIFFNKIWSLFISHYRSPNFVIK